ncbi:MAG: S-layer homology domain-containing protein [Selenomonas bovis]|nr:S-layer homology domain-containing protein [Selenomonas bovis]
MKLNKKATALLLGLTLGISGTAFAADGADSFSDVPQGHWAYDALDYLAKDGVIDGMGDGTFQGNRTMTRYEMASIVAKAMQKGNLGVGDQAVLEKLEKEYGSELATLSKQVNANTKAIKDLNAKTDKFKIWGTARVQVGDDSGLQKENSMIGGGDAWKNHFYNGDYNNRFYMDLEGQMKINDHAVARFTIEKNARYSDKEYQVKQRVVMGKSGKVVWQSPMNNGDETWHSARGSETFGNWMGHGGYALPLPVSGELRDMPDMDTNHSGAISNIWVELQLGPKHDWYTNIGRKWNGIGMQNLLLGGQVDGIATYHPIEHGHGWWVSAQYWKSSSDATQYVLNYTPIDKDGHEITEESKLNEATHLRYDGAIVHARRNPINATIDFWGPLGKYVDANIGYTRVVGHKFKPQEKALEGLNDFGGDGYWNDTSGFFNADLAVKLFKDFKVTGSYVKAFTNQNDKCVLGHGDRDLAVRFDYRGTDLNKVGSWGAYAKWMNLGAYADLGHDDEWTTREPTFTNGVRGWYFGFKCVPAHNVEWETMWAPNLTENFTYGGHMQVKRHILRSWLDFHF